MNKLRATLTAALLSLSLILSGCMEPPGSTVTSFSMEDIPAYDGWRVHPLPYLAFDGDLDSVSIYREAAILAPYIGAWARDIISVEETPPEGYRNLLERY